MFFFLSAPHLNLSFLNLFQCDFAICRKMRTKRSGKNEFMPFDGCDTATDFDEKNFQLSIHLSGGIFQSEISVHCAIFHIV